MSVFYFIDLNLMYIYVDKIIMKKKEIFMRHFPCRSCVENVRIFVRQKENLTNYKKIDSPIIVKLIALFLV